MNIFVWVGKPCASYMHRQRNIYERTMCQLYTCMGKATIKFYQLSTTYGQGINLQMNHVLAIGMGKETSSIHALCLLFICMG